MVVAIKDHVESDWRKVDSLAIKTEDSMRERVFRTDEVHNPRYLAQSLVEIMSREYSNSESSGQRSHLLSPGVLSILTPLLPIPR